MMIDGAAVKQIGEYAQGSLEAARHIAWVGGVPVSTVKLFDARQQDPVPAAIEVHSLAGFAGYVHANRDDLNLAKCLVHVVSPTTVELLSPLHGQKQRSVYVRAKAGVPKFEYGRFYDREGFNIALQSLFADVGDRGRVLQLLKHVSDEAAVAQKDDGVTQRVEVKSGIHLVENANVPNPVTLAPFRTFAEVEQPTSPFVLRLRKGNGVEAALFEADGGAWRIRAVQSIAEWLIDSEQMGEAVVLA